MRLPSLEVTVGQGGDVAESAIPARFRRLRLALVGCVPPANRYGSYPDYTINPDLLGLFLAISTRHKLN